MTGGRQTRETAAMLLVGDGVLGILQPSAHCEIWRMGYGLWDSALSWFSSRPSLVRGFAAAEIAAGLWLAQRQFARLPEASSIAQAASSESTGTAR